MGGTDRTYAVAAAPSVSSARWPQLTPDPAWADFVAWLDPDHPGTRKDCGGYVAGRLIAERRGKDTVLYRSMLVLDADAATATFLLDLELGLPGVAGLVHTTWSHTAAAPRYRVVLPLARDVDPDEYRLVARAVMAELGADQFDLGSTQPERLMYRPSCGDADAYRYVTLVGQPLDPDVWVARALETAGEERAGVGAATGAADWSGPGYGELTPGEQELADNYVAGEVAWWRAKLAEVADWPVGVHDERGRGWDAYARDCAWALARMVAHPWTGLDEGAAGELYDSLVPDFMTGAVGRKWDAGVVAAAARAGGIAAPPWRPGDFVPVVVRPVDVTSQSVAFTWLQNEIGAGGLSGMFYRTGEVVHTSRVGEDGYVPPRDPRDYDGPVKVHRIGTTELAARVDVAYLVTKQGARGRATPVLFPAEVAARVLMIADLCPNLRPMAGVTYTPMVRADGSVLYTPGYDVASGMLYLPSGAGGEVPIIPDDPTRDDVESAGKLLLTMTADFPWATPHDRANYLAVLLTPLLRALVPPPYKLAAINAPQRGSGKSLLAALARHIHGGVFKSEFPTTADEQRKVITAFLDSTSAPIIQFDNVTGVLRSSVLDGLLTSAVWVDRILGATESVEIANDRLWVLTGNNLKIGGDLARRTMWITIDANMEHPERRTQFKIQNLERWTVDHRSQLLEALLVLIRAWVCAGRPMPSLQTTDSYGAWVATCRGILAVADLGDDVGLVDCLDAGVEDADTDETEWTAFLAAVYRVHGDAAWTTRELMDQVGWGEERSLHEDELPGDIAEKWQRNRVGAGRSLGKWLSNRENRWAGGYVVRRYRGHERDHVALWRVMRAK